MKARIVFFVIAVFTAIVVSAQQKPTPIDLNLGTSFVNAISDTATTGEANAFNGEFMFRGIGHFLNFGLTADYVNNWHDTAANDRLRVRGILGNTQAGFLGSGTGYYESVYNEIGIGYEFFFKASHYIKMDEFGGSTKFRKEATTHSVFAFDKLGFTSEGIKDGSVKVFREHEISLFGMYSFSESMKTTFGDNTIPSSIDPEDARTFFYDISYKAEIIGISLRRGSMGIGIDGGVSYSNMSPFGFSRGWKFTGGISLNSYHFVGHCLDVSYSRTALPDDKAINEISFKINPVAFFYALR